MKKLKGTIKPQFSINSFSSPLLQDEEGFYLQKINDGVVVGFESIILDESEIIPYNEKNEIKVSIKQSAIYCFLYQDNKAIYGTLETLKPKLFKHLTDDKFNPIAKNIICTAYKSHGNRILNVIDKCNEYFERLDINSKYKFDTDDFIEDTEKVISKWDKIKDIECLGFYDIEIPASKEIKSTKTAFVFIDNYKTPLIDFLEVYSQFDDYDYLLSFQNAKKIDIGKDNNDVFNFILKKKEIIFKHNSLAKCLYSSLPDSSFERENIEPSLSLDLEKKMFDFANNKDVKAENDSLNVLKKIIKKIIKKNHEQRVV